MDNSDLNFDYPPPDENTTDIERKIKAYLRKYSINFPIEKDIERYSDKYNESVLINMEMVGNYLYSEMMSPEICDFYKFNMKTEVEEIDKQNISDLEWDSDDELEREDSSEVDGDYKIAGEDDEDSEDSVEEEGDVL
ncbi:hypothetical protein P3W45_000461 [Vairimorpha bombi]|jgi:hypothetical protein